MMRPMTLDWPADCVSGAPVTAFEPGDGSSSDAEFDGVYEARIRDLSEQHWTPVGVAARAAKILTLVHRRRNNITIAMVHPVHHGTNHRNADQS